MNRGDNHRGVWDWVLNDMISEHCNAYRNMDLAYFCRLVPSILQQEHYNSIATQTESG